MEALSSVLPIVIDILLVVLLTVCIILVIKCIYVIDKAKKVVDNVEDKVNSLNGLFNVVNIVDKKIENLIESLSSVGASVLEKVVRKRKGDDRDE